MSSKWGLQGCRCRLEDFASWHAPKGSPYTMQSSHQLLFLSINTSLFVY